MFNRLRNIAQNAADRAITFAELKANPDLLGMNGLASAFALLILADRVAEEEEMEAVSEYLIDEIPMVIEKNLIREVSQIFLKQVTRLEEAYKVSVFEGNIVSGEILNEIAAVKTDPMYAKLIVDTLTLVTSGGSADAGEIKTRDRILAALGR